MSKLRIKLYKIEDTGLAMKVLEQSDELRGKGTLYDRGFYAFYSLRSPELFDDNCSIRGDLAEDDGNIAFNDFPSNEERDTMHDFIIDAVKHINAESDENENSGVQVTIAE